MFDAPPPGCGVRTWSEYVPVQRIGIVARICVELMRCVVCARRKPDVSHGHDRCQGESRPRKSEPLIATFSQTVSPGCEGAYVTGSELTEPIAGIGFDTNSVTASEDPSAGAGFFTDICLAPPVDNRAAGTMPISWNGETNSVSTGTLSTGTLSGHSRIGRTLHKAAAVH